VIEKPKVSHKGKFKICGYAVRFRDDVDIIPFDTLPSLRVKILWKANQTKSGHRAVWYGGHIEKYNKNNDTVLVNYDDGDKYWEARSRCQFC
tara:strand:+ start:818 stop:1093 length:276 start_codon:yes stop_codon:yes gene_type:complete